MFELHCLFCHGWKYAYDEFCGGEYCLKYPKRLKKKTCDSCQLTEKELSMLMENIERDHLVIIVDRLHGILSEVCELLSMDDKNKAMSKAHEGLQFIKDRSNSCLYKQAVINKIDSAGE